MNTFTQTLKGVKNRDLFTDLLPKTNEIPTNRMFHFENDSENHQCSVTTGAFTGKFKRNKETKVSFC